MESKIDTVPFEEWQIRIDSKGLDILLNDDLSLNTECLSSEERAATDVLVAGREHGSRSVSALLDLIVAYNPRLIIHESSFSSEHSKHYANILVNGLLFGVRSLVGAPSQNIPLGQRAIRVQDYLSSVDVPDEDDVIPLLKYMRSQGIQPVPVVRYMGETDPQLHSLRGKELEEAHESTNEKTALIDEEARKIIDREAIMKDDISRIIANFRRKIPLDKVPQLNVLVVSGLFHASFLQAAVSALGVSPAGVTGCIAVDGKRYRLESTEVELLAADSVLLERIKEIRRDSSGTTS